MGSTQMLRYTVILTTLKLGRARIASKSYACSATDRHYMANRITDPSSLEQTKYGHLFATAPWNYDTRVKYVTQTPGTIY